MSPLANDPLDAALRDLEGPLGPCPRVRFEWSSRASLGRGWTDEHCIVWVDAARGEDFSGVASTLRALGATTGVRAAQRGVASTSVCQGVGLVRRGSEVGWRLYLHHRDPATGANRYDAYSWDREQEQASTARYEFHFLPDTPDGRRPEALVHPLVSEEVRRLCEGERLQQLGGFWLRERRGQIDQLCLTFPWHPKLAELAPVLGSLAARLGLPAELFEDRREHRLRHLGFSTGVSETPRIALYCSAQRRRAWPRSLAELQAQVREGASAASQTQHRRYFSRLPPPGPSASSSEVDLDGFYSPPDLASWRAVLGDALHYHFGMFGADELDRPPSDRAMDEALERAVTSLLPHIPEAGRVYDLGCGWGAPARILTRAHRCQVLGITNSSGQRRHCAGLGLTVRKGDMQRTLPPGRFDCALLLESLSHVPDKQRLLTVLRLFTDRLVMRVHCQDAALPSRAFGGTMHMVSSSQLRALLEASGWSIQHWQNVREASMPTVSVWHRRLAKIPRTEDVHLEAFRRWSRRVCSDADAWAQNNPLIEVVCSPRAEHETRGGKPAGGHPNTGMFRACADARRPTIEQDTLTMDARGGGDRCGAGRMQQPGRDRFGRT